MRRFVKPSGPGARILDPDHMDFLPPDGREVAFTPYWLAHETQGNVVVSDIDPPDDPLAEAPPAG